MTLILINSSYRRKMPNTGMIHNQTYKCDKCRNNFNDLWLPTNVCCRVALLEKQQATYSRHSVKSSGSQSSPSPPVTRSVTRKRTADVALSRFEVICIYIHSTQIYNVRSIWTLMLKTTHYSKSWLTSDLKGYIKGVQKSKGQPY